VYVEGTAQIVGAPNFSSQAQLRQLLEAIEEKHRLVSVLNACIDAPDFSGLRNLLDANLYQHRLGASMHALARSPRRCFSSIASNNCRNCAWLENSGAADNLRRTFDIHFANRTILERSRDRKA